MAWKVEKIVKKKKRKRVEEGFEEKGVGQLIITLELSFSVLNKKNRTLLYEILKFSV